MKIDEQSVPLHILLADDDLDDRLFFDKALMELPVATKLTIVNNGEELMDNLTQNLKQLPDIIFLDLSMPRKTGIECLAEIKENDTLKNIAVVMFTTSFTKGIDFEQSLINTLTGMGAADFIRKPGNFEELKVAICQSITGLIEKGHLTGKKINYEHIKKSLKIEHIR